jgi:TonB-dependent starch-binding outer membrane protein SusC
MKKNKRARYAARCLWMLMLLCSLVSDAFTQATPRKISGKVSNQSSGEPVGAATITIKGQTVGAVTSTVTGDFSINAKTGDILVISSVGYKPREFKVGNASSIDVRLVESYNALEDVVVVGYGKMKKTDLSSSQVTVTAEELKRTVNTTLDQALQGRAANVYVTNNSGQPGAAPSVIIRGLSSLSGSSQPLYVIDGVQMKPENPRDDQYSHPAGFANALSGINPDDVETINILQGPSATAIYGAVGANGVVMITTKRGKAGETKIAANTLWTLQDKPEKISVMDLPQYAAYRNEVALAGGAAAEPLFADPSVLGKGTDWQDELYRRTWLQKHGLSLSGGTDKTTFFLSGEYFNQDGIAPGSGFQRASLRLNLENKTRNWLKIGTSLAVNRTMEKVNTTNAGIITLAIQQNPSVPVKNPDGSWGGPNTTQYAFSNPVALANIYNDYNKALGVLGGLYADVTLLKGLVWHTEGNTSIDYRNNYTFHPGYEFNGYIVPSTSATSSRAGNNSYWWNFHTRLQYDTKIKKHSISAMAAHEAQANYYEGVSGSRTNYVTYNIQELSGGVQNTSIASSNRGHGARESYFGRVNYVFDDRYILQGVVRYDGSSAFGEKRRWGLFPAMSAAWRISQEKFMEPIDFINDLKLRVEYGVTGNSNALGYYARLASVPTAWGTGFLPENFDNPYMQWEADKVYNVGIDLNMFNNRVEIVADAYVKKIEKLLTGNPYSFFNGGDIAYSPGYLQWPTTNVGNMRNNGFGITVNTVNISSRDITWKTSVNFSRDRNKITKLVTPINPSYAQAQAISKETEPASLLTGYIAEGIFQSYDEIKNHARQSAGGLISPTQGTWIGDIKFKDISGPNGKPDGVIDNFDRGVIGNPWPTFTFGFNNSITYKNFDLNMLIIGSVGNDILNLVRFQNEQPLGTGVFSNYYSAVANFAKPSSYNINDSLTTTLTNPGYNISRIAPGDPNGNNRMSQWYVEDGSYVRLKNISLTYNVPSRLLSRTALRGVRATVNVQNLFTITNYSGYDPEIGPLNVGGAVLTGVDIGRYPNVRMYSFALTAEF